MKAVHRSLPVWSVVGHIGMKAVLGLAWATLAAMRVSVARSRAIARTPMRRSVSAGTIARVVVPTVAFAAALPRAVSVARLQVGQLGSVVRIVEIGVGCDRRRDCVPLEFTTVGIGRNGPGGDPDSQAGQGDHADRAAERETNRRRTVSRTASSSLLRK